MRYTTFPSALSKEEPGRTGARSCTPSLIGELRLPAQWTVRHPRCTATRARGDQLAHRAQEALAALPANTSYLDQGSRAPLSIMLTAVRRSSPVPNSRLSMPAISGQSVIEHAERS